jgi:DNA-binding transcriptional LysR family regulator
MTISNLKDLAAFVTVAEESSFTRAAARLGMSQSALSQVIRGLETRLGLRLFARTTRSVSLTNAGEQLLGRVGPAMCEIDAGLNEMSELSRKPAGQIRMTADEFAVQSVLQPAITRFQADYPEIRIEIVTDYGLADIVSGRFDAGVRRGRLVAKDMIAVRIGPDIPMAVVGAPRYFDSHGAPKRPPDLVTHACFNLRLPTRGEFLPWLFTKAGREHRVKVDGPLVFSSIAPIRDAALEGAGLAYLPRSYVSAFLASGHLVEVLADWRKTFEGYHLYYANRRIASSAFALLVEALRYSKS